MLSRCASGGARLLRRGDGPAVWVAALLQWAAALASALGRALAGTPAAAAPAGVLRPGDVLVFRPGWGLPPERRITVGLPVGRDGAVDLGPRSRVPVAGLTAAQARAAIEWRYRQAVSRRPARRAGRPASEAPPGRASRWAAAPRPAQGRSRGPGRRISGRHPGPPGR